MLFRFTRLDAAKRAAIASNGDPPLHRDAEGIEARVVLDETVVDVDDVGRHVTRAAVSVHGEILSEPGRGVARHGRFGERKRPRARRNTPQMNGGRVRDEYVVPTHLGLEPHRLHLRDDIVPRARLRWRACHVRLR